MRRWSLRIFFVGFLVAWSTPATAAVTYGHNYLTDSCCTPKGVRSQIRADDLYADSGTEILGRVIARASESLSAPGAIQAGWTYTDNVGPSPDHICGDAISGTFNQYWASQTISGTLVCELGPQGSFTESHNFAVLRVSDTSTTWKAFRDGSPISGSRDIGFSRANLVAGGGRVTSTDAQANFLDACYGCGSNPAPFSYSNKACCDQTWLDINGSSRRVDANWTVGLVPSPFRVTF